MKNVCCAVNYVRRGQKIPNAAHPAPLEPFDHFMMDFVELSPCRVKKYYLVIIAMFSKWIEVFPTGKADAAAVAKALLMEIIPRWGIPRKFFSDRGTHFVNKVLEEVSKKLGIEMKFHCAYHPQSGGAVERVNGTLKSQLTKVMGATELDWVKALPIVLTGIRGRVHSVTALSPYEVITGRPMSIGCHPPGLMLDKDLADTQMVSYCVQLTNALRSVYQQVKAALPVPARGPLHDLQPGDWVVIKDFRRKKWHQPRWRGPYQVFITPSAAQQFSQSLKTSREPFSLS